MKEETLKVKVSDDVLAGRYANILQVSRIKSQITLDYIFITQPEAVMVAKITTSPEHYKRMVILMENTLDEYEKAHGEIKTEDSQSV